MVELMNDIEVVDENGVAFIITQTNKTVFRVVIPGGLGFGGDKMIGGRFYSLVAAMAFLGEWIDESKKDRGRFAAPAVVTTEVMNEINPAYVGMTPGEIFAAMLAEAAA